MTLPLNHSKELQELIRRQLMADYQDRLIWVFNKDHSIRELPRSLEGFEETLEEIEEYFTTQGLDSGG